MKVLSLFSGIGAFEKALDNLEIPYELIGYCEIDKYASASYSAIHNVPETMNLGDITKVDEKALPKDIDLLTYGFPCQDISLAGKQKGLLQCEMCNTSNPIPENYIQRLKDGEKFYCEKCGAELKQTRSGLFFEALRIIEETKPRVAIAENVKNLTSKKFKNQFNIVLDSLEMAGYNNYWAVLNAKDFGVPQNRERVFIVSIRKDIDKPFFYFPKGFPLELRLKDILEDEVDERYYLSDERIQNLIAHKERNAKNGNGFGAKFVTGDDVSCALTTSPEKSSGQYLTVKANTKKGYDEAHDGDSINFEQPNSKTRRGRVGHGVAQTLTTSPQQGVIERVVETVKEIAKETRSCDIGVTVKPNGDIRPYRMDEKKSGLSELQINKDTNISNTITTAHMPKTYGETTDFRIRKLTPKECFRLMGFDDADVEKAEAVNSNTQLYKQAGNSIVVPVVEYIIQALLDCGALNKENEKENQK